MAETPPDVHARYKASCLLDSPEGSDSECSSTVSADSRKVLIRDATETEREILEAQRYKLSWAEFDAQKAGEQFRELIGKPDTTQGELTKRRNKQLISEGRRLEIIRTVNGNRLVQLYNKANPKSTLNSLAMSDAKKLPTWINDAPRDRPINDVFKIYMSRILPRWKLTVQELDDWSPVKKALKDCEREFTANEGHANWALHPQREAQEQRRKNPAVRQEMHSPKVLLTFREHTERLREKIEKETELKLKRDNAMRHARSEEERAEANRYWTEALRLVGVGNAANVGWMPEGPTEPGIYIRKRIKCPEGDDVEAFPSL